MTVTPACSDTTLSYHQHVSMLSVVILVACLAGTTAIHCEGDYDLEDVQSFTQEIQHGGDMNYWRTRQKNFQGYGRFDGDPSNAVVTGGMLLHLVVTFCHRVFYYSNWQKVRYEFE